MEYAVYTYDTSSHQGTGWFPVARYKTKADAESFVKEYTARGPYDPIKIEEYTDPSKVQPQIMQTAEERRQENREKNIREDSRLAKQAVLEIEQNKTISTAERDALNRNVQRFPKVERDKIGRVPTTEEFNKVIQQRQQAEFSETKQAKANIQQSLFQKQIEKAQTPQEQAKILSEASRAGFPLTNEQIQFIRDTNAQPIQQEQSSPKNIQSIKEYYTSGGIQDAYGQKINIKQSPQPQEKRGFEKPFFSATGQKERATNVGNWLMYGAGSLFVKGKATLPGYKINPQHKDTTIEKIASHPYEAAFVLQAGAGGVTAISSTLLKKEAVNIAEKNLAKTIFSTAKSSTKATGKEIGNLAKPVINVAKPFYSYMNQGNLAVRLSKQVGVQTGIYGAERGVIAAKQASWSKEEKEAYHQIFGEEMLKQQSEEGWWFDVSTALSNKELNKKFYEGIEERTNARGFSGEKFRKMAEFERKLKPYFEVGSILSAEASGEFAGRAFTQIKYLKNPLKIIKTKGVAPQVFKQQFMPSLKAVTVEFTGGFVGQMGLRRDPRKIFDKEKTIKDIKPKNYFYQAQTRIGAVAKALPLLPVGAALSAFIPASSFSKSKIIKASGKTANVAVNIFDPGEKPGDIFVTMSQKIAKTTPPPLRLRAITITNLFGQKEKVAELYATTQKEAQQQQQKAQEKTLQKIKEEIQQKQKIVSPFKNILERDKKFSTPPEVNKEPSKQKEPQKKPEVNKEPSKQKEPTNQPEENIKEEQQSTFYNTLNENFAFNYPITSPVLRIPPPVPLSFPLGDGSGGSPIGKKMRYIDELSLASNLFGGLSKKIPIPIFNLKSKQKVTKRNDKKNRLNYIITTKPNKKMNVKDWLFGRK